jgi:ketosteroid isomerase-like protein
MRTTIITFVFLFGINIVTFAQDSMSNKSVKETISALEKKEAKAVLDKNIKELKTLWSDDFLVNSPGNIIVNGSQEVIKLIEKDFISYSSFEREIETMMILDNIVIVMGRETVKPSSDRFEAGTTLQRRYTNIWKQVDKEWQLTARHAHIICEN